MQLSTKTQFTEEEKRILKGGHDDCVRVAPLKIILENTLAKAAWRQKTNRY